MLALLLIALPFSASAFTVATYDSCMTQLTSEQRPPFSSKLAEPVCRKDPKTAANCAVKLRALTRVSRPRLDADKRDKAVTGFCSHACKRGESCDEPANCFEELLKSKADEKRIAQFCGMNTKTENLNCFWSIEPINASAAVSLCSVNPGDNAQNCLKNLAGQGAKPEAAAVLCARGCSPSKKGVDSDCEKAQNCMLHLIGVPVFALEKAKAPAPTDEKESGEHGQQTYDKRKEGQKLVVVDLGHARQITSHEGAAELCKNNFSDEAQNCVAALVKRSLLAGTYKTVPEAAAVALCAIDPSTKAQNCLAFGLESGEKADTAAQNCRDDSDAYNNTTPKAAAPMPPAETPSVQPAPAAEAPKALPGIREAE